MIAAADAAISTTKRIIARYIFFEELFRLIAIALTLPKTTI
jgi:hypothetical protein